MNSSFRKLSLATVLFVSLQFFTSGCHQENAQQEKAPTPVVEVSDEITGEDILALVREEMENESKSPEDQNGFSLLGEATVAENKLAQDPYEALGKHLKPGTAETLKALEGGSADLESFLTVLDVVREVSKKPHFSWPRQIEIEETIPWVVIVSRSCASLCVLARKRESEGKLDEAVGLYVTAIQLSGKLDGKHLLLPSVVRLSASEICEKPIADFMASKKLSDSQYKKILEALKQVKFSEDGLLKAMDGEYVTNNLIFDSFIQGTAEEATMSPDQAKELKLAYDKYYLPLRSNIAALETPENLEEIIENCSQDTVARSIIENLSRDISVVRLTEMFRIRLTRFSALKVLAALGAYQAKNGEYPESLESLVGEYFDAIPRDYCSLSGKFFYKRIGSDFVLDSRDGVFFAYDFDGNLRHHRWVAFE